MVGISAFRRWWRFAPERRAAVLVGCLLVLVAGCGGDDGESSSSARVAGSQAPNGAKWQLSASAGDGELDLTISSGDSGATSGGFDASRDLNLGETYGEGPGNGVYGSVSPKVAKVNVHLNNGTHRGVPLVSAPANLDVPKGTRFYALFTGKQQMRKIIALDASGTEIAAYAGRPSHQSPSPGAPGAP